MNEPVNIEALRPVAQALETLGIEYYIGGSIASSFHGRGRSTADIDIVASLRVNQIPEFVALLEESFYADAEMMDDAVRNQSSFNVIHRKTSYKIDIFLPSSGLFDRSVKKRLVRGQLPGEPGRDFPIASAEDTILSKLVWYRMGGESSNQQWSDVQGVLKVQGSRLDASYLRSWADDLGVLDLLERAQHDAG